MTDLSPQAQAVLDAFDIASDGHYDDGVWVPHIRKQLAAALRAAADQEKDTLWPGRIDSVGAMWMRDQLLSIANELEQYNG